MVELSPARVRGIDRVTIAQITGQMPKKFAAQIPNKFAARARARSTLGAPEPSDFFAEPMMRDVFD
jgi:hypothetical protein